MPDCTRNGTGTGLLLLLGLGLNFVTLFPTVMWSDSKVDGESRKAGLWKYCTENGTLPEDCVSFSDVTKESAPKIWDAITSDARVTAAAGVCGAVIFGVFALLFTCCRKKCPAITLAFIVTGFSVLAVGAWIHYENRNNKEGKADVTTLLAFDKGTGFICATVALVANIFALITSCCIAPKGGDDAYRYLA